MAFSQAENNSFVGTPGELATELLVQDAYPDDMIEALVQAGLIRRC